MVDTGLELPASNGQTAGTDPGSSDRVPAGQHPTVDDVLLLDGNYPTADATSSVLVETHLAASIT